MPSYCDIVFHGVSCLRCKLPSVQAVWGTFILVMRVALSTYTFICRFLGRFLCCKLPWLQFALGTSCLVYVFVGCFQDESCLECEWPRIFIRGKLYGNFLSMQVAAGASCLGLFFIWRGALCATDNFLRLVFIMKLSWMQVALGTFIFALCTRCLVWFASKLRVKIARGNSEY